MRTTRRTLTNALQAEARRDVPPPSASFIDDLEQRLFTRASAVSAPTNVLPFRRRVSRGVAIGVVAAVVSGAGAAAVAIVRVSRPGPAALETTIPKYVPSTTVPVSTSSTSSSTSTIPSTTTAPAPPTTAEPAPPTTAPPATTPVTITTPPATVAPVNIAPVSSDATLATDPPPVEPPPTTAAATVPPSTEVQSPATIDLACTAADGSITCTWSAVPDGTDHVALLRSTPADARGRVLLPGPGATSFVDTNVTAGQPYTYLVHAMDASGHSLAHSTFARLTCCG